MRHEQDPLETTQVVSEASPAEASERRKAGRSGRFVMALSLIAVAVALIAMSAGQTGVAAGAAGLFLALLVVGLVLYFDRERQRPRSSPRGQTPSGP